jgi:hypothetical protein
MKVSGICVRAAIVTALLAWAAVPASAQDTPSGEFSAGWKYLQAMNVFGDVDQSLPAGWYADVSGTSQIRSLSSARCQVRTNPTSSP